MSQKQSFRNTYIVWSLRIVWIAFKYVGLLSVRINCIAWLWQSNTNRYKKCDHELTKRCSVPVTRPCRVLRTFCMFQRHMLITMWTAITMDTAWKATWRRPGHKPRYLSAKREHVHAHRLYAFWHTAWRNLNHLQPSGHYMYRKFNIQQFHVLTTQLYLCFLCGSQNKQPLFPYTSLTLIVLMWRIGWAHNNARK